MYEGKERRHSTLTHDDIHSIVKDAVKETLQGLGVDVQDPLEMQEDLAFLRKQRTGAEKTIEWAKKSAVATIVTALLGLLWMGFSGSL